jgi:hypothetical protein
MLPIERLTLAPTPSSCSTAEIALKIALGVEIDVVVLSIVAVVMSNFFLDEDVGLLLLTFFEEMIDLFNKLMMMRRKKKFLKVLEFQHFYIFLLIF